MNARPFPRQSAAAHRYLRKIEHEERVTLRWPALLLVIAANVTFYGGLFAVAWLIINAPK